MLPILALPFLWKLWLILRLSLGSVGKSTIGGEDGGGGVEGDGEKGERVVSSVPGIFPHWII